MKTTKEFYEDEKGGIDAMAKYFREKGYEVETYTNMEGTYTVAIHTTNEDAEHDKHFACFDVI